LVDTDIFESRLKYSKHLWEPALEKTCMNFPHLVQGVCAKAMVYFIPLVISPGPWLPQMQSPSLLSAAIHGWFVMCPGRLPAVGMPHVQRTSPSLSPRRRQTLELADKQTKGWFF